MSRATSSNVVTVQASSNIYTALVIVACLGSAIALLVLVMRAKTLFGGLQWMPS